MLFQKLFTIVASMSLMTIFFSGSVNAQPPLPGIIQDFCAEIATDADDAQAELREATRDLQECADEFDDCQSGFIEDSPMSCLFDYQDCTDRANTDQQQACGFVQRKFRDAYEDALRQARLNGPRVERRFQLFLLTSEGAECLQPAVDTASLCGGVTD